VILDGLALSRSAVDRAGERRTDPDWLAAAWVDENSRAFAVAGAQVLVRYGDRGPALWLVRPAEAPEGERYFLGVDAEGTAYFAVATAALPVVEGAAPAGLREVGALLDDREAGLAVHAIALANWHAAHRHCARCGAPTVVAAAGHVRRCTAEGSEHHPRTDPAVIMAVVDAEDRLLLGHQARWPARRFSTLAGFVEPGESLEQAVRREVAEETGVRVGAVHYLGSQPWPFPSSLMLGFRAEAWTTELAVDGEELAAARWFDREELTQAAASGEVLLPPPVSIARRLIEHWYGAPLPEPSALA
jgi:NAD+ diphosphatase